MTKIKLCGMMSPTDIAFANEVRPDFIGLVMAPGRHQLSPNKAAALRKDLADGILSVGVFVDAPIPLVTAMIANGIVDMVQLHGHEDLSYLKALRKTTDCPLIKAGRIVGGRIAPKLLAFPSDFLLLDGGKGGEGIAFDWDGIERPTRPFFLAGGLVPSSIERAIATLHPYAVDLSSGIEIDGKKDRLLMEEAVRAAHASS